MSLTLLSSKTLLLIQNLTNATFNYLKNNIFMSKDVKFLLSTIGYPEVFEEGSQKWKKGISVSWAISDYVTVKLCEKSIQSLSSRVSRFSVLITMLSSYITSRKIPRTISQYSPYSANERACNKIPSDYCSAMVARLKIERETFEIGETTLEWKISGSRVCNLH